MFSAGPPGSWKQLSGDSDALASIYMARWPRPLLGVTMRRGLVRLIFVSPYSGKVLQDPELGSPLALPSRLSVDT